MTTDTRHEHTQRGSQHGRYFHQWASVCGLEQSHERLWPEAARVQQEAGVLRPGRHPVLRGHQQAGGRAQGGTAGVSAHQHS